MKSGTMAASYGTCSADNEAPLKDETPQKDKADGDDDKKRSVSDTKNKFVGSAFILLSVIVGQINVSMIAPTFPQLALNKGLGAGRQSFVFNMPDVVALLLMPVWGKLVPSIGSKFIMVTSAFSLGFTSSLFGLLEFSPGGTTFYVLALIIRFFEGKFIFFLYHN